ncbi:putative duf1941 family protein [Golovinomyces cichoracearum]|uniref:Putative duf1941 family protein n=1 Tax=Golovinomyces cichoracearum TaxID=62708 RepID=A0A420IGM9_9PEZI|nr:putative duf1941 family protein [Golovinomyces cichoracearum]
MDSRISAGSSSAEPDSPEENSVLVEKIKNLFSAKEDTSRFVGFGLLKTVLDNGQVIRDADKLQMLWESVPSKFLDRLLRAQMNEKISNQEAQYMVDLATSVLNVFVNLLPETYLRKKRLTSRIHSLIKALFRSSNESTECILQTLSIIVSHLEGSVELLNSSDISPLVKLATQNTSVLNIFQYALLNLTNSDNDNDIMQQKIDDVMVCLVAAFENTDAVTFINFLAELLPKLQSSTLSPSPRWLKPLIGMIRNLVIKKPTVDGRTAYTKLAAGLLLVWPGECPKLLFGGFMDTTLDSKPFSYFFVNLLLIDLRSSLPTLLSKLNSPDYHKASQRLSAAFDVVSSFIGFLVRSIDEPFQCTLSLTPELLLKLRKNVAETMSLTIEYMRDRWDASVAGAPGLHPSARSGTPGERLGITWGSMKEDVSIDPVIFAGIRTLAIWIREDENQNLRLESAGLMDMWIDLYRSNKRAQEDFDYRFSIASALEGIMCSYDGVESFLSHNGWGVLVHDLENIIRNLSKLQISEMEFLSREANRGIQIVKNLLLILDHPNTGTVEEAWMSVVKITAGTKIESELTIPIVIEFHIATIQLSLGLLTKAADGMTKRYITSQAPISGLIRQLLDRVKSMEDRAEAAELIELLQDASLELVHLRKH